MELGLPFIRHKEYTGMETDVSEYTMSEIIASVYDVMEESGVREGILFLDEINCVSETLAPSMLQFLQYKVFGRHQVPEGWAIVTAGNPPEYNKSVREFDVVTMDRVRVLEVEADYESWKAYARDRGLHNAILNFLDLKKEYFYRIETTVKGRSYVTARGWEDLSEILYLYEEEHLAVDETLIGQYLRNDRIVKEFSAYYDLYQKYKRDYRVEEILAGLYTEDVVKKAASAPFDERLSLLGMLLDKVQGEIRDTMDAAGVLSDLVPMLKAVRAALEKTSDPGVAPLENLLIKQIQGREKMLDSMKKANALSEKDKKKHMAILRFLEEAERFCRSQEAVDKLTAFGLIRQRFEERTAAMKVQTRNVQKHLSGLFGFAEAAFASGNEMLLLMTELTVNESSSRFIATFGCPEYQRHNEDLLLSERQGEILEQIRALEL